MALSVLHTKVDTVADWTQADLDAQIALGNFAPGTLLADIVLASDWNSDHSITGTKSDFNAACSDGDFYFTSDGASTATASKLMLRDADANSAINNIQQGYTATATSAGTLTLTKASTHFQRFTGTNTHTLQLPDATTLALGWDYRVVNASSGAVTINKGDGTLLWTMAGLTSIDLTCQNIATSGGGWNRNYTGIIVDTAKAITVNNSMTMTATDGSSIAFGSGGTVLYNGGALGTPSSGTLTNCTFPTLNQSTTGSAASLTTGRTISGTGDATFTTGAFDGTGNVSGAVSVVKIQGKDFPTLGAGDDQKYPKYVSASNAFVMTTIAGGGDVTKVGTPVNNQVGVWTGDGTLEGDAALTYDSATDTLTSVTFAGNLTGNVTGNTSGSSGSCTGNAATVTTNANLTGQVTSVGNAATLDKTAISAQGTVAIATDDTILFGDTSNANALAKCTAQDIANLAAAGGLTLGQAIGISSQYLALN